MLSILIPIYNYDASEMVIKLSEQCKELGINYEIVCYDDGSDERYREINRVLDHEFGVSYIELQENKGRSKIRNMLARNARYEKLLFIDCDSEIKSPLFISNYLKVINEHDLIYGGREYTKEAPIEKNRYFHWYYGSKRESLPTKERVKKPYRSFQTNNFIIARKLIMEIGFDEKLTHYGYEDLLLAETLKNKGINIKHIHNPLIHKGVEKTDDFLNKSILAAKNLALLYHSGQLSNTKMIAFHEKLKKIGFNSSLQSLIRRRKDKIIQNLHSGNPRLFYFDLFRYDAFFTELNSLSSSSS